MTLLLIEDDSGKDEGHKVQGTRSKVQGIRPCTMRLGPFALCSCSYRDSMPCRPPYKYNHDGS